MSTEATQVPLTELLRAVPADARILVDDADGKGTRNHPVGALCLQAAKVIESEGDALTQCIQERDNYHEWADRLATAISAHFGVDIGEHSSINNPWREALEAPPVAAAPAGGAEPVAPSQISLCEWAVSRWLDEVENRPLVNVHRRTLDDTWRQVIRFAGGDPDELVGPSHDSLLAGANVPYGASAGALALTAQSQPACQACGDTATRYVPEEATELPGAYCADCGPGAAQPEAPAEPSVWDGKLHDTLQRALNALRLEVAPSIVDGVEHEVRSSFRALWTSNETLRRMYRAAQDRCDAFDAAQPDPFTTPAPAAPAELTQQAANWVRDGIADFAADNWPDRRHTLPEIEAGIRAIEVNPLHFNIKAQGGSK